MKKFLMSALTIVMSVCLLTGCGPSSYIEYGDPNDSKSELDEMDYSIVASEASEIEFEQFDNGLMSMMIPSGGDVVRASFKNIDNREMEGIFTASPKLVSLYYVNAVNVYNIIFFIAPKDELINWVDILNYCVGTITFSDDFTNAFYGMQDSILQSAAAISQINAQTSAIITEGWANRQTSYDIISQKQSDATLGFDRVLDENTGDIYRAYNGFLDEYGDDGFVAVSDDMYLEPVSGYIVK